MTEARYFPAPPGWSHESENPFTADGGYGKAWSCFRVVDEGGEYMLNFLTAGGLRGILINRDQPDMQTRLADFLRYEAAYHRHVIVSLPEDIDIAGYIGESLRKTPAGGRPRSDDPRWMVHSTTREAWRAIHRAGELRSYNLLNNEGMEVDAIGLRTFGEPDDYGDYVMLGRIDHIGPEHVVQSRGCGYVLTEEDAPYQPGIRLYFDGYRIIGEGLLVRDGVHSFKVKDRLPLRGFLAAAIGAADADPLNQVHCWTPRSFLNAANDHFRHNIGIG